MSGELRVTGLTKAYGDKTVLDGVDLSVGAGQILGFVGPNGAGKTTTMRAIMGVLTPDAGTCTWQGRPVDRAARRRFGYMPEERGLYQKMAVGPQIDYFGRLYGLGPAAARRATEEWLERLEIGRYRDAAVQTLSLGNQQRVQFAVSLVHDPELLVLDEPFSGLDPIGAQALVVVLREKAAAGVPIVFSSHQLDLVDRLIDRITMLKAGHVVLDSSVADARRTGEPRLRVRVAGAPDDWAAALPGRVVETDADGAVVLALDGADPTAVLTAAMGLGTVEHFAWDEPTLTELFREAMA